MTARLRLSPLLLIALAAAAAAQAPSRSLIESLHHKCRARMGQLAALERENAANIAWEISPIAVRGTYLGYASEHSCTLGSSNGATPTATLRYQEVLYSKSGKSKAEAETGSPRPVEITETTEVFVFQGGAWR